METHAAGAERGERGTVDRLREDEASLERGIADVRRAAAEIVEGARREAEAITGETRREAERAAERLRRDAADALERLQAEGRVAAEAEVAEVARGAARNRERAVERLVALVTGGAP